ncbi:MAG: PA14 domain-containing protein [Bacteroidota bacterium]
MTKLNKTITLALGIFLTTVSAQKETSAFDHILTSDKKPWTNKPFFNDPANFRFAIVSDRTGGHRPGVFSKGIEKINMLYPEFVMSVGDLIEGYTKDNTLIDEQWAEFDGMLDSLSTKFFYVAGNHDYSNTVMAQQWRKRFGAAYYSFIYKDVLFLILNSNDGDGVLMGKDQLEFAKKTIAQNTTVRWTLVFVHHPMWAYAGANGFNEIETALKGRDYTVFAGHNHRYMHEVRNDQNHYVLATTGGGSRLRGPKFGEFDEIAWVTMTQDGPKLANLALSGVIKDDISTTETKEMATALLHASDFKPLVMTKGNQRKVLLSLTNDSDTPLYFRGKLYHHHQITVDSSRFNMVIPPKSAQQLTLRTMPLNHTKPLDWDPLELEWKMGYETAFMEPDFSLSGTEVMDLNASRPAIALSEQDIFINKLVINAQNPYKNVQLHYGLDETWPNAQAPLFNTPIALDKSTTVKVIATDNEGFESAVVEKKYHRQKPVKAVRPKSLKKGIAYSYYEGHFDQVPNFATLNPVNTGVAQELDPDKISQRLDHFAIQYTGFVQVPETGVYTFYLRSDDGAKLYVNNTLVVDNDGSHSASTKTGMIAIKKGWHPLKIGYFEDFLGESLQLHYEGPDVERKPVLLWH